jgi:glutamyl-tRNA reductase
MVMVLVGASHHDVDLRSLERLATAEQGLARHLVSSVPDVSGAVVLSTCNRFEVYLDLERFHEALEATTGAIASLASLDPDYVADALRVVVGKPVAQHLFSVAAGLESMVVGEDEIAGQVRHALAVSQSEATTSPALERLLQRALSTSKSVARSTGLGAAGRSIVSVGLDLMEQRHGPVRHRRTLVLGTGSYARVVVAALERRGCEDIGVFSASGRASRFAATHDVSPVEMHDLAAYLSSVDFVAACSGAPHPLIDAPLIEATDRSRDTVLPILDLALSPDVATEVRAMPHIDVIDLSVINDFAPREQSAAIIEAQQIVLSAVDSFESSETDRNADDAIVAMRSHVMTIINEELARIRRRVDPVVADEVALALNRVSNALLHAPSIRAKELARTGDFAEYSKAVHTLFGIDVSATPRD